MIVLEWVYSLPALWQGVLGSALFIFLLWVGRQIKNIFLIFSDKLKDSSDERKIKNI